MALESTADQSYRSDINWVIMDYLVAEGYPKAAEKFAQETKICNVSDMASIRERVQVRDALRAGNIQTAIEGINEIDPEILDQDDLLHFQLLQLQLIEIIRTILAKGNPQSADFRPALEYAVEKISPKVPISQHYQQALERTMALMIFPADKMAPEFQELLNIDLREEVATAVNSALLRSKGQRAETKIRQLVRARAWAENQARTAKVSAPGHIGLDAQATPSVPAELDAMIS